ncbi:MAG TPA: hypothetical protein VKI64_12030 [Acidimicrobiales bacterium]|nr:hypothetical protein [Acidimicrobiales bacterium]
MAATFVASRVAYRAAGVRFDASPLKYAWQYLDPALLRHDLMRSLWYLHSQPPLFNLVLGLVLHVAGHHQTLAFQVLFTGVGLALALGLHALMRELGVAAGVAAVLTAVFVASPAVVLYENWLYVEYPAMLLLVVAGLYLHRFAVTGRRLYAAAAFGAFAAVVLSRTLFHLVWIVALFALVYVGQTRSRRNLVVGAALPLALCAGLYVKNLVLFGTFSSTSCAGLNVARMSTFRLSKPDLEQMVRRHQVSDYALAPIFALPLDRPGLFASYHPTGVPALDEPLKSTGTANFNHRAYIDVCRRYLRDAVDVARIRPGAVIDSVRQAVLIYFRPSADYPLFDAANRRRVHAVSRGYDAILLGQLRAPNDYDFMDPARFRPAHVGARLAEVGWLIVAAYVVAGAFGIGFMRRAFGAGGRGSALGLTLAYILFTLAYVTAVGNLLDADENNRFRVLLDPFVLTLLGLLVTRARARARGPRAQPSRGPESGAG